MLQTQSQVHLPVFPFNAGEPLISLFLIKEAVKHGWQDAEGKAFSNVLSGELPMMNDADEAELIFTGDDARRYLEALLPVGSYIGWDDEAFYGIHDA
jgi:hypothetical protein